jgi:DNA-binding LacI/PurR family transcriptional regulator
MKFEAITIKDIAKALGLSTSTVSRALRDSYEISPETKERVIRYAKQNNYRPNPIALSLKEKRSGSIGVIVSEIANSFFSQVINGIESIAQDKGYNVVIAQSKENLEREITALQYLASRSVDGIIISVSAETDNYETISQLYSRGMPMVGIDRVISSLSMHKVTVNNTQGAFDATRKLIDKGFKNIACIGSATHLSITQERVEGFRNACTERHITINNRFIQFCDPGGVIYEEVEDIMHKLMNQKKRPDAIIACSDNITTNIMRYCKQYKISIPKQLALIGFSNLALTELLCPSLSIIKQPATEMGQKAAELLISVIESKRPINKFETIALPTQLYERESSVKLI